MMRGSCAGLCKLQDFTLLGDVFYAEEKQGVLYKMLKGVSSLHIKGFGMRCDDIASPSLRNLTALVHTCRLPGADRFSAFGSQLSPVPSAAT